MDPIVRTWAEEQLMLQSMITFAIIFCLCMAVVMVNALVARFNRADQQRRSSSRSMAGSGVARGAGATRQPEPRQRGIIRRAVDRLPHSLPEIKPPTVQLDLFGGRNPLPSTEVVVDTSALEVDAFMAGYALGCESESIDFSEFFTLTKSVSALGLSEERSSMLIAWVNDGYKVGKANLSVTVSEDPLVCYIWARTTQTWQNDSFALVGTFVPGEGIVRVEGPRPSIRQSRLS